MDEVYSTPQDGVTMEEFAGMLHALLEEKLGQSDHSKLLEDLLNLADVNRDSKVFSLFSFFNSIFVSIRMYPENPEWSLVVVGSMNMG